MVDRTAQLPPKLQAAKVATGDLIDATGGQARAATYAGRVKRQQEFSDFANVNVAKFIALDTIAELERVTHGSPGWPQVTRFLCSNAGGAFVELPEARPSSDGFIAAMGDLTKEYADVSGGLCAALADGTVSAADVRRLDLVGQADELIAVAVNVRAMLERIAAEG